MRAIVLGTGTSTGVPVIGCRCSVCTSPDPRDRRTRCSTLIKVEDSSSPSGQRNILIDCSPDFRQQMLSIEFESLDAIIITHEHYDHVGGIDDIRPYSVFGDITVYAEPYCAQHLMERIPYCFPPKDKRYPGVPGIELCEIDPKKNFSIGRVNITPIRVLHGKLPILGYRIGNFAYITDMHTIPEDQINKLQGIKTLIVNGLHRKPHYSHQTIEQAIEFAQRLGMPETYLIHMAHSILPHAIEEAHLPEHVHLAYDGMELEL